MSTECHTCSLNVDDNGIACDLCDLWYHSSCTNLTPNEFNSHCNNEDLPWTCDSCIIHSRCGNCNLEFKNHFRQKKIHCNHCDKYFHIICAGHTTISFNKINAEMPWYCR